MGEPSESQVLFEKYVRGDLALDDAADALEALLRQRKASGGDMSDLRIQKPDGWTPSEAEYERAEALMEEMDRRATMG
jgi:hypothetical protein